jgi:multiple sugar transport system permease protein
LALAVYSAICVLKWAIFRSEPDLRASVAPFSLAAVLALVLCSNRLPVAIALVAALCLGVGAVRPRGKQVGLHAALLIGSVVFALPFLWLIVSSFKEDADIKSATAATWVPYVSETSSEYDDFDPLYAAAYKGTAVEARMIGRDADGTARMQIERPLSLAGATFQPPVAGLTPAKQRLAVVRGTDKGEQFTGVVLGRSEGKVFVEIRSPGSVQGRRMWKPEEEITPAKHVGLRTENYGEALDYLPPEAEHGLAYLRNTLFIAIMCVIGTVLSCSLVAYAFARLRFPGRKLLFTILLSTMMLPSAVTLLPTFLIYRWLGWVDTLLPLWVPSFLASAFNVFLLRQFFLTLPRELEESAKLDGSSYLRTFWSVMLPQVKPALAVVAIWTFVGAWNNFLAPLIYLNSPEKMPISYALKLLQNDRGGEPALLLAFATMAMLPILLLFVLAQRYFVEGVRIGAARG